MTRTSSIALLGLLVALAAPLRGDEGGATNVAAAFEIDLYGTIKLDAAYDTAQANPGNFVRWVELFPDNPDDDRFNMTANQTRLGLRIGPVGGDGEEAPEEGAGRAGPEVRGRVEIDFFGGGAENKSNPLLRHAYVELAWPEGGWRLLAGQSSDVFSPLYPKTINYSVAWWAGNVGYRRPQLRATRTVALTGGGELELAAALARTIGDSFSEFASCDAGADAGRPGVQARLGFASAGERRLAVGLSGHWAEEEYDLEPGGTAADFESWSVNLDLALRAGPRALLQAELFEGANLATYLGGIGQGVNLERGVEVAGRGGWLSLDLGPWRGVAIHLGGGLDDPDDADLEPGDRGRNSNLFVNALFPLASRVRLGVELSSWETEYVEGGTADDLRTQVAVLFDF